MMSYEDFEKWKEKRMLDLFDGFLDKYDEIEKKFEDYCWTMFEHERQYADEIEEDYIYDKKDDKSKS